MATLKKLLAEYPKPKEKVFRYGTAGFREKAVLLDSVFLRMGMLAWIRAVHVDQAIGLMTTASHNLVEDNGVKMIDPDGGMLEPAWEVHAAELANKTTPEESLEFFKTLAKKLKMRTSEEKGEFKILADSDAARVCLARDTRPHSAKLSELALKGAEALGATTSDYGVLTTPQLHFIVQHTNFEGEEKKFATEGGYYTKLSRAYNELVSGSKASRTESELDLVIDAGFGVGGLKFKQLIDQVNADGVVLKVDIRNVASVDEMKTEAVSQKLNNGVGAEHVQKKRELPKNTYKGSTEAYQKFCSFDGDADRIVYFFVTENDKMMLLDGDKIASLLAAFVKRQLSMLPKSIQSKFKIGAVQTAYANGASMDYLHNRMGLETPLVATGVKHCHHKALEYDVGVYFEANGHGTVLFKSDMIEELRKSLEGGKIDAEQKDAILRLINLSRLINQAAGDAMADALAIEAILKVDKMTIQDFAKMYDDLPSRQLKVKVKDRTKIKTIPDESKTTSPTGLQPAIDKVVKDYESGRAFVRPSGTEDVVRIYAEAKTQELADELAQKICQVAYDLADGVGERP